MRPCCSCCTVFRRCVVAALAALLITRAPCGATSWLSGVCRQFWYSWHALMDALSRTYHCVAIDMRGYGDTQKPPRVADYTVEELAKDVAELIPALGHAKAAAVIGHDWGGVVTWIFAHAYPQLVERVVVLAVPHPMAYLECFACNLRTLKMQLYTFLLQIPYLAELVLRLDDYAFISIAMLSKRTGCRRPGAVSPAEIECYKYAISRPHALTGSLNFYRAVRLGLPYVSRITSNRIATPVLMIWGEHEAFISIDALLESAKYCDSLKTVCLPNVSHWVMMDEPDTTAVIIADFLAT